MEDLKKLIDNLNVENIITGNNVSIIDTEIVDRQNCIDDIRSAAFYAFGQSKITNKNIALIIDGNFISNIYTVLTEAWFQNTNIIVISLYNSIYDINVRYLDRCSVCNMSFFLKDIEQMKEKIKESLKINGPKIYNVVVDWNLEEQKNDYSNLLDALNRILKEDDELYLYNSNEKYEKYKEMYNITNIDYKYKYGIISKYVAYLIDQKSLNKILICKSDCLKLDSNILNTRYMSKKFKMIVIDDNNIDTIKEWCSSNKINFLYSNNLDEDLEKLYNQSNATILVVKGGK